MSETSDIAGGTPEIEHNRPLKVLVVEDDRVVAQLVEAIFSTTGDNITVVSSAREAMESLRENKEKPYDWMITDWGLKGPPEEDGFYLVSAMNKEGLGGNTYVTMLTARASEVRDTYFEDGLDAKGIHGLIGKPFKPKELMDIASKKVRSWQALREK